MNLYVCMVIKSCICDIGGIQNLRAPVAELVKNVCPLIEQLVSTQSVNCGEA